MMAEPSTGPQPEKGCRSRPTDTPERVQQPGRGNAPQHTTPGSVLCQARPPLLVGLLCSSQVTVSRHLPGQRCWTTAEDAPGTGGCLGTAAALAQSRAWEQSLGSRSQSLTWHRKQPLGHHPAAGLATGYAELFPARLQLKNYRTLA